MLLRFAYECLPTATVARLDYVLKVSALTLIVQFFSFLTSLHKCRCLYRTARTLLNYSHNRISCAGKIRSMEITFEQLNKNSKPSLTSLKSSGYLKIDTSALLLLVFNISLFSVGSVFIHCVFYDSPDCTLFIVILFCSLQFDQHSRPIYVPFHNFCGCVILSFCS